MTYRLRNKPTLTATSATRMTGTVTATAVFDIEAALSVELAAVVPAAKMLKKVTQNNTFDVSIWMEMIGPAFRFLRMNKITDTFWKKSYCSKLGNSDEVLFIAFIMSCSSVIWSLVSLYVTHPNPLLLQPVSFTPT